MSHNGIERNRFIHAMTYKLLHLLRNALRLELFLPPVVRISGTVVVRRVRGKLDKFVVVQRKQKRSSSRERDICKRDRNDTISCSESASQAFSSENDIGNFVGVPLTDADRRKVLFNCWSPPSGFSFLYVTVGAQNRSFQKQWLNDFAWLVYSNIYNGAFCKMYVVFSPQTVSRSAKPPSSVVSGPHGNYKKAKDYYNNHQNCHYHKLCADRCRQIQRCTKCFQQQSTEGCRGKSKSSFPYH